MLPAPVGALSGQSVRGAALHTDPLPDATRCQAVLARAMSVNTSEWWTEDLAVGQMHGQGDLKQALSLL